jgi:hypothetical protein
MKKINTILIVCIVIAILSIAIPMFTQALPPDPECDPLDPACPIDGGVTFMIAAGIGLGAKRLMKK